MDKSDMQKKALTLEDLMAAESSVEILRHSQKNWYPEDVRALQNKLPVKRNSQLYKLDPHFARGHFESRRTVEQSCHATECMNE